MADTRDPYKVINYDNYNFQASPIIKPKQQDFDQSHSVPTRVTNVIVNSSDRNKSAYPTPSDYVAELYEEIQDVISVELKVAILAYNPYNITSANDTFNISYNSSIVEVKVKHGKYTGSALASALESLCIATIPSIQVVFDDITQHFVFTAIDAFGYMGDNAYVRGTLLKTLGFPPTTQNSVFDTSLAKHVLESTFAADLAPYNMMVMNVDAMNVKVSFNNIFNKAFGIIPQNLSDYTVGDVYSIKKVFNPPNARIDKLRIRFTDVNGFPYDFQNKDHLLEFEFLSHKNIRKYHAYVS